MGSGLTSESHAHNERLILGVTTVALIFAILSYLLRLLARRISKARYWYDDGLMLLGLFFAIIVCVCDYVGLRFGYGKHASTLPVQDQRHYLIDLFVLQLSWSLTFFTVKLSVVIFYHRIFPSKKFLRFLYGIALYTLLLSISNVAAITFQCQPVQYFWDHSLNGHCVAANAYYIASGSLNLASDIFILLTPIPLLWKLNISKDRKLGLIVVFLLGGLTCVISFIRVLYLNKVDSKDITYSNVGPGLLSTAECTVLVISANLPLMKPLFSLWSTKARASYGRKRQYSEIEGPFPPTSLSPQIKTEISQAEHNPGHPLSDLELQNNQVGVRTEISQRTELRQSTVPTCDN